MKSEVTAAEPRVQLDLSADEFVAIYALHYKYGGGDTELRYALIEPGLNAVVEAAAGTVIERACKALANERATGPLGGNPFYKVVDRVLEKARS